MAAITKMWFHIKFSLVVIAATKKSVLKNLEHVSTITNFKCTELVIPNHTQQWIYVCWILGAPFRFLTLGCCGSETSRSEEQYKCVFHWKEQVQDHKVLVLFSKSISSWRVGLQTLWTISNQTFGNRCLQLLFPLSFLPLDKIADIKTSW